MIKLKASQLMITVSKISLLIIIVAVSLGSKAKSPSLVKSLESEQLDSVSSALSNLTLRQKIAQKLTIDLRYFCEPIEQINLPAKSVAVCNNKMTSLPDVVRRMIAETSIGGIILFSENLSNINQITTLNHQLQQAAQQSRPAIPLFISVDQEGGRVARLPRNQSTPFTGNMSIGATHRKHRTKYALMTGDIIAKELLAVGFNTVHAPNVDVNVNPDNPVINVRSFGADPKIVAELGSAQSYAFERQGLISTLKHFPGHGDTNVDSHTGLPVVNHDKATIEAKDLYPFRKIIEDNPPGMIMTAHIQFPKLDASTFISSSGVEMIRPATMSRKILTRQLRHNMGYQGVIITDSLKMAGISEYFKPVEAVINTFSAGADIALMPLRISNAQDIEQLKKLIQDVEKAVLEDRLAISEIDESVERILKLKNRFKLFHAFNHSLPKQIASARQTLGNQTHKKAEAELANHAITLVKNDNSLIPLKLNEQSKTLLVMPDKQKCRALKQSMQSLVINTNIVCQPLSNANRQELTRKIEAADVVIFANISPSQNAMEIGGEKELANSKKLLSGMRKQPDQIEQLLKDSKIHSKKTVFVSLRAPYDISRFSPYADAVLATYSYNANVMKWPQGSGEVAQIGGPAYTALAEVILGKKEAFGDLPVDL